MSMTKHWGAGRGWLAVAGAAAMALSLGAASEATAGGFTFPELGAKAGGRGGAYMLGANGPEVIYFNPALLTRLDGSHITLDLSLHTLNAEFTRAGTDPNSDTGEGFATVENESGPFPEPMLFMSSDFGLDDFAFGLGFYGPNAYGSRSFPEDGPQRFILVESQLLEIYYSAAAAWRWEGLRLGATFQLAQLSTKFTTVTSAAGFFGTGPEDEDPGDDARTSLDMSAFGFTGILGVAYDVNPSLSFGLTYQLPVDWKQEGTADIKFSGLLEQNNAELVDKSATFEVSQADIIRASARYAHIEDNRELFDVELTATYEFWSRTEEFVINIAGPVKVLVIEQPLPEDITLDKSWEDTFSVRLGGDFNPMDTLSLRGGVFYESAAVPTATTHLDFLSWERIGVGLGASYYLGWMDIDLAYMFINNFDRTVTDGRQDIVAPLTDDETPVVNNGEWSAYYQSFSVGLTFHFDENDVLATTPAVRDLK